MILIGIVGSIAGGKSTVATYLSQKGAVWINADVIAKEMLNDHGVVEKLVSRFGQQIVEKKRISRPVLAELVFGDDPECKANLRYLESIVHPRTRTEITNRLRDAANQNVQVAILDIPLLFESKWDLCCDQIWCVDSPRVMRQKRTLLRGWDVDELAAREASQLPMADKSRLSNVVVQNDGTLESLHEKVDRVWENVDIIGQKCDPIVQQHCLTK